MAEALIDAPTLSERGTDRRFLLAAILLSIAIPAIAAVGFLATREIAESRRRLDGELTSRASEMTRFLDSIVLRKQAELYGLAVTPVFEPLDRERIGQALDILSENEPWSYGALIDASDGSRILLTIPTSAGLGRAANWDQIRDAVAEGRPYVTIRPPAADSPVPGRLLITGVPVRVGGRVTYLLTSGMPTDRLSGLVTGALDADEKLLTVVAPDGTIVARSRDAERFVGQPAQRAFVELMGRSRQGTASGRANDGTQTYVAYETSAITGLTSVVAVAESTQKALASRAFWLPIASALLALLGAAGLTALVLARRAEARLSAATMEGARRLAAADQRLKLALGAGRLMAWEHSPASGLTETHGGSTALTRLAAGRGHALMGLVHPDDAARLGEAFAGIAEGTAPTYQIEYRIRGDDGATLWISEHALSVSDGGSARVLAVSQDVTERYGREAELAAQRELFDSLVNAVDDVFWVTDADAMIVEYMSPNMAKLLGREGEGGIDSLEEWLACVYPGDRPLVELAARRAFEEGVSSTEYRIVRADGGERWVRDRVFAMPTRPGGPRRIAGITSDITREKEAAAFKELVVGELRHRIKNMMAVVQSMATNTARSAGSLPEFQERFQSRLGALSRAQDLLTTGPMAGARLDELIASTLGTLGPDLQGERVDISGPPLEIAAEALVSLAMTFHELGTNALKYGALSLPGGRVRVAWEIAAAPEPGGTEAMTLLWREEGGPAVVAPKRVGFGSRMIEMGLRAIGGEVALDYAPDGLQARMTAPLSRDLSRPGGSSESR